MSGIVNRNGSSSVRGGRSVGSGGSHGILGLADLDPFATALPLPLMDFFYFGIMINGFFYFLGAMIILPLDDDMVYLME